MEKHSGWQGWAAREGREQERVVDLELLHLLDRLVADDEPTAVAFANATK